MTCNYSIRKYKDFLNPILGGDFTHPPVVTILLENTKIFLTLFWVGILPTPQLVSP